MNEKIVINKENIGYIRDAFSHFFPEDTVYSADGSFQRGDFGWKNRNDFIDYVYKQTGVLIKSEKDLEHIKKAELEIEKIAATPTKTKKPVESNVPERGLREEQEAERVKREAEIKESTERAKIEVQTGIKRQQQLVEELKNKQVYVKVQAEKTAQLSKTQQEQIDVLKNATKADPRKLIDQVTAEIEKKIASTNPQGTTPEEIHLLAKQTAYDTVKNLQGSSLAEDTVVAHAVAKGESVVARAVSDTEAAASLQTAATNTANQDVLRYTISRKWASSTFGKEFAEEVFGPESLDDLKVSFSSSPQEGFYNYDLSQIPQNYLGTLNNQNFFLGSIKDYGVGEIKSQFLQQASTQLETWIGGLPSDSFLAQTYNSELVQGALSYFGLGGSAVSWEGTTFFGQIAVDNGFGPILGWLGEKTGIDFGITKLAGALGEEVVGSGLLGEAAGGLAAEGAAGVIAGEATAGVTAGAAAGAAAGSVIPIVGTAIGAAFGWLASKIDWQKFGPVLIGGVVGLGAIIAGLGFGVGVAIGAGVGVLASGALGGLPSLAAVGSGIAGFFGALGAATIAAIGMPILVTLLAFPVVVALILFIINSGAYVVPPGMSGGTVNIACNSAQSGQVQQQPDSPVAEDAICIVSYLNQFELNPLTSGLVGSDSWRELERVLAKSATGALEASAIGNSWLQCVGFTSATAGLAYGTAFQQINACSYIGNPPAGYSYTSGTAGIKSGDFFVMDGTSGCKSSSPGHIGVVVSVDGALISCADANVAGPGKVRATHGCFALSQIKGYLRKQ